MHRLKPFATVVVALLAITSGLAQAQQAQFGGMRADISAPVELAADAMSVNQADGTAVLTGNVVIGQGEMRLSADRVRILYAEGAQNRIEELHAEGAVTLVSGEDAAEASEAIYDVVAGQVTLIGDVVLAQRGNVLSGERMTVDLATGAAEVQGRVRSILQPGGN